ncbi:hypothetical protein EMPG_14077 [Blastomyces silverae]|uniref:Uncharacterized protein n=1 Tax=Blastomyces silverae TaxID=2060906 RepID=A0A0H1BGA3_9EURO|nr:hypothetical protein EMPG_14077 [Blastomyces silverae]
MGWIEHPHAHRRRRSALLPSDISLTPEEEALIVGRTGRKLIPPPDAPRPSWPSAKPNDEEENKAESSKMQEPENFIEERNEPKTWTDSHRNQERVEERTVKSQQNDPVVGSPRSGGAIDPNSSDTIPVEPKPAMMPMELPSNRNRPSSNNLAITERNQPLASPPTAIHPLGSV